ncbi:damage-control phosphatase ARMT1 family protein [Clostridium oryzae]|uniref:Damage-control phosphatase ARMT1-like metal-binding domain-containing protein n=1 Tax=Clostridium oryzae TaxID=1450648 RepID=A0A1V4IRH3_9CLOT|nr:ARMT1-like domain-containing protein [Clostridium oryzae]OPJ62395.1 hypothetical protein CLORY_17640 [Clostridium oryzae]
MKVVIDCVHCYLKQAVSCMTMANIDADKQHEILYSLMDDVKNLDRNGTPCDNSSEIIFKAYEKIGIRDPYESVKKESNDMALSLYEKLEKIISKSNNRLYDALKIAVAGNVIDLGINRNFDIDAALEQSLKKGFAVDDFDKFYNLIKKSDSVLILGDNAGEIVFDKILVKELKALNKKVIYSVKSGAVLNDSTMYDAHYTGMDEIAQVVESGSSYLGTPLTKISNEFKDIMYNAPVIISKGQANYESLSEEKTLLDKIFFLLKIKCECVGTDANAPFGEMVFFKKGVK